MGPLGNWTVGHNRRSRQPAHSAQIAAMRRVRRDRRLRRLPGPISAPRGKAPGLSTTRQPVPRATFLENLRGSAGPADHSTSSRSTVAVCEVTGSPVGGRVVFAATQGAISVVPCCYEAFEDGQVVSRTAVNRIARHGQYRAVVPSVRKTCFSAITITASSISLTARARLLCSVMTALLQRLQQQMTKTMPQHHSAFVCRAGTSRSDPAAIAARTTAAIAPIRIVLFR